MTDTLGDTLDRERCALVVIDVQEKLADAMERRDEVVATTARLVRTAGVLSVPVLVTRQYPKGLGDTVPEVREALDELPDELHAGPVDKTAFCCGEEAAFREAWERTGRGQAIVCGMETHICVAQTALWLHGRDPSVGGSARMSYVVADAACSRVVRDEEVALDRMRQAGVVVTTAEAAMYELLVRAGTPEFKAVLSLVKGS